MSQPELLVHVLQHLEENKIEYMITGSVVSSIQGEPRSTHDIDIVVNITKEAIPLLIAGFLPPHYYVSSEAIEEAIRYKSMFNLLDTNTGNKVDFWMLSDEAFDQERFKRKYLENLPGLSMYVSSPEDTIIMKLRWAEMSGGSTKQLDDVRRVYELQYFKLDFEYIERWVVAFHLETSWTKIKQDAKPVF